MNQIIYVGRHALTLTVSPHNHSSWELIYCTSGGGELIFADRTLRYGMGDIAVIPPFLPHSNRSADGFTNIYLNLADSTLTGTEPRIIPADQNGFLLGAFTAAFYYYSGALEGRTLVLPIYGQLIAALLSTRRPEQERSEVVRKIEDSILQNYPDCAYDLNACLHSLPFNSEYVKKLFKKETGLTPLQYLTDKRLESAANILAINRGRRSISETAHLCGFNEPLYFSRLFKKKFGVSPRDYVPEDPAFQDNGPDSMKIML